MLQKEVKIGDVGTIPLRSKDRFKGEPWNIPLRVTGITKDYFEAEFLDGNFQSTGTTTKTPIVIKDFKNGKFVVRSSSLVCSKRPFAKGRYSYKLKITRHFVFKEHIQGSHTLPKMKFHIVSLLFPRLYDP